MTLGGWKLVARGTSQVIRDLELSPPPLTSKEGTVAEHYWKTSEILLEGLGDGRHQNNPK